ncbi:c-type cytochrome [Parachryseolinea silvisoli]|uniref:c-type cytochrome n=1 Tax=Parachryseolinea silvisoli TaxID=2873601 RepID=UPI002265C694|nr:c-type cytochrome [Parachryseolinea silvisoli]MCD9017447.1 c-type cytochrome [Parachryseolinea silvisoli]
MIKKFTASACKFTLVLVFALLTFSTNAQSISTEPAAISAGESLFNANCKACHRVHQKLVGPALAGVYDRTPSIDWIKSFVKNSSKVIASGDDYANKLYNEYNKTQMTAFSSFKDEDIMNILAYVKAETDKPTVAGPVTPVDPKTPPTENSLPAQYLNVILIGMIVILILLLVVLGFLVSALKRFLDDKQLSEEDKEVVSSTITVGSITRSRGFIFVVVFLVAGLGFKAVINNLFAVGVQIGYAPKQPIAFSHKIHAGQLEIDCKYCHVGVTKGKSATIPSVNICMNCHNQVKSGATTGEGEIAKIVKAWETKKPIEWIRIHNLPDLAYFNHSQHVSVGGVECQTCHGPIETMDVVRQHSLLTMGWCIDCHRKTDVNSKGNAYYDNLVELHSQSKKTPMKVEDIGGLECSKCHY